MNIQQESDTLWELFNATAKYHPLMYDEDDEMFEVAEHLHNESKNVYFMYQQMNVPQEILNIIKYKPYYDAGLIDHPELKAVLEIYAS